MAAVAAGTIGSILDLELPASLWPALARFSAAGRWPPENARDADRLVRAAAEERLFPLLFSAGIPPPIVQDALERARAWRQVFSRRAAVLDRAVLSVPDLLAGEPFLFLKGADYRYRLYSESWLRPMQDIDVLVPARRIDAASRRLKERGIPQRYQGGALTRVASYHERLFDLGEVTLEIHHSFVQRVRYRVDYEEVWARRAPLAGGPPGSERLGNADGLLYHAISFANDEFAVPLIRFVDFWLLCRHDPEAVAEAAERARVWRAERALYGALQQTARVFPEFETDSVARVRDLLLAPPSKWFLDRAVLPRGNQRLSSKLPRASQLWRKFWLVSGFSRRAAFAAYHVYASLRGAWLARKSREA